MAQQQNNPNRAGDTDRQQGNQPDSNQWQNPNQPNQPRNPNQPESNPDSTRGREHQGDRQQNPGDRGQGGQKQ
jgi:hypothetical protein